jgi:hypothetical protein
MQKTTEDGVAVRHGHLLLGQLQGTRQALKVSAYTAGFTLQLHASDELEDGVAVRHGQLLLGQLQGTRTAWNVLQQYQNMRSYRTTDCWVDLQTMPATSIRWCNILL